MLLTPAPPEMSGNLAAFGRLFLWKGVVAFNIAGHLVIGSIISLFVADSYTEWALVFFGSLLPDIDHPRSTLGKYNPFTCFMAHRGKCHTLVGALLLSVPFYVFGSTSAALLVFGGAVGHLCGDKLASWLPGRHRAFKLRIW